MGGTGVRGMDGEGRVINQCVFSPFVNVDAPGDIAKGNYGKPEGAKSHRSPLWSNRSKLIQLFMSPHTQTCSYRQRTLHRLRQFHCYQTPVARGGSGDGG